MAKKILLKPEDFDALHLSALEFGGIGAACRMVGGVPHCIVGHAAALDGVTSVDDKQYTSKFVQRLRKAGLSYEANDAALEAAGVGYAKVGWETYVKLLNIDVQEG